MRSQVAMLVFAIVFGAETSAAHAQLLPRRDLSYSIAKTIAETAIDVFYLTKKGEKRIKEGFKSCQFLTEDRMCGVYEARPSDCRGYVCWNQEDETVYDYAVFLQEGVGKLRDREKDLKKSS